MLGDKITDFSLVVLKPLVGFGYRHKRNVVLTPNHTLLAHFGRISGEFGRAMVHILAQPCLIKIPCLAKIPMASPNEPDIPPKHTKKVRSGIYRTQIQPKLRSYHAKSGQ